MHFAELREWKVGEDFGNSYLKKRRGEGYEIRRYKIYIISFIVTKLITDIESVKYSI